MINRINSKTEQLIEFWERCRDQYARENYTADAERCNKHVCALRNDYGD